MPVTKKYTDGFQIGGTPHENLQNAVKALEAAGFKKINVEGALNRVQANWKPIVGTLWGDITVTFMANGTNTDVQMVSVAGVDNIYTLVKSPGKRIFEKFLDEFNAFTVPAGTEQPNLVSPDKDVSEKLKDLVAMLDAGHLNKDEFELAKKNLLGG